MPLFSNLSQEKEPMRDFQEYQKHPIYKTDFQKKVSVLIEEIRNEIDLARGHLMDLKNGTIWHRQVEPVIGLLTCGVHVLYSVKQEITVWEAASDDKEQSPSPSFFSYGINWGFCPHCGEIIAPRFKAD